MRPYRKEKIASVVQSLVGEAILRRLNDPRIEPLTTVTRVEVTGDLTLAKVYLSVLGDEGTERRTLQAMRHAAGFMHKMLAQELAIRQCPELRFEIDRGIKEARRTMALLEENRRLEPELFTPEGKEKDSPDEEAESGEEDETDTPGPI